MVLATPASDGNDYMPSLPEGIRLRLMKASDVSVVRALHASLLPVQYPHAFFVQLLLHSRYLCVVATHEDAVVAFASAAIDAPKERVEHGGGKSPTTRVTLLTLGVQSGYRQRGIGRALVHLVARQLRASSCGMYESESPPTKGILVQAEVARSNTTGKSFYSRLGMNEHCGPEVSNTHGSGVTAQTSVVTGLLCV